MPEPNGSKSETKRAALLLDKIMFAVQKVDITPIDMDSQLSPFLSSPRAKRAVPKGLRAESARAFTGRRNSYCGRGEDFLSRQQDFFTETAVTPKRKVEKLFPRWEMNSLSEGYEQVVD